MGSNILFDKNPPSSPGCTVDGVTAETTINNLRDWDFKPSLQLQSASERQHCTSWLSPSYLVYLTKPQATIPACDFIKEVLQGVLWQ